MYSASVDGDDDDDGLSMFDIIPLIDFQASLLHCTDRYAGAPKKKNSDWKVLVHISAEKKHFPISR